MKKVEWEAQLTVFDLHLQRLRSVYSTGNTGVLENGRTDRLAGKATISLCFRRSEVLMCSKHYLRAQSEGQHPIY